MNDPLFCTYDLRRVIENHHRELAKEVNSMGENDVLNTSQEDLIEYLTEKWKISPVTIDDSGIRTDYEDAQINISGNFDYVVFDFIAECKFWSGPAGLTKALDQMLGYTAWRDTKAALLIFNRERNTSTVLEGVAKTVKDHPNCKREQSRKSDTEFRYVFSHRDDANREITVTVLVFDVPA